MAITGDRLAIRNRDPLATAVDVVSTPRGGVSDADVAYVRQAATSGRGRGLTVQSDNPSTETLAIRGSGPLLRMYNAAGELKFEVANDGSMTGTVDIPDNLEVTTLTTSGNTTVNGVLDVNGASTLSATSVGGTLGVTGATTLTSLGASGNVTVGGTLGVTGATTLTTLGTSGAATLASVGVTANATVGGTLGVTGATTLTSLGASGNATVGGTLGVTGATTLSGSVGFYGTSPVTKQAVTGSLGGNAALTSLVTALAAVGLITNSTVA